jgi:hypothetical protein
MDDSQVHLGTDSINVRITEHTLDVGDSAAKGTLPLLKISVGDGLINQCANSLWMIGSKDFTEPFHGLNI